MRWEVPVDGARPDAGLGRDVAQNMHGSSITSCRSAVSSISGSAPGHDRATRWPGASMTRMDCRTWMPLTRSGVSAKRLP